MSEKAAEDSGRILVSVCQWNEGRRDSGDGGEGKKTQVKLIECGIRPVTAENDQIQQEVKIGLSR